MNAKAECLVRSRPRAPVWLRALRRRQKRQGRLQSRERTANGTTPAWADPIASHRRKKCSHGAHGKRQVVSERGLCLSAGHARDSASCTHNAAGLSLTSDSHADEAGAPCDEPPGRVVCAGGCCWESSPIGSAPVGGEDDERLLVSLACCCSLPSLLMSRRLTSGAGGDEKSFVPAIFFD